MCKYQLQLFLISMYFSMPSPFLISSLVSYILLCDKRPPCWGMQDPHVNTLAKDGDDHVGAQWQSMIIPSYNDHIHIIHASEN